MGGVKGGASAAAAGGLLQQLVVALQVGHLVGADRGAPRVGRAPGRRGRRRAEHAEAGQRRYRLAQALGSHKPHQPLPGLSPVQS